MSIKIKGLRDIERKLDDLARKAEEIGSTNQVPLSELFPPSFMQQYTPFDNLEAMFEAGGFGASNQQEWNAIPQETLDAFVAQHTRFSSWQDMLNTGAAAWTSRQLGFR